MDKIKMVIKDLKASRIKMFYDIVLLEDNGKRALSISIGEHEADDMAMCLDNLSSPRPLTFDSEKNIMQTFGLNLKEVVIDKFFDGYFCAKAVITQQDREESFDMRPSDALNLAIRFGSAIYATDKILDEVGFDYAQFYQEFISYQNRAKEKNIEDLSAFGINMLNDLLKDAIEKEDYVTASLLRDKIRELSKNDKEQ